MEYELAKALKDAGFHQEGCGTRVAPSDKIVARRDDFAYVPTLEELIEACGDDFCGLTKSGSLWEAATLKPINPRYLEHGLSHVVAVARLWLALNKK